MAKTPKTEDEALEAVQAESDGDKDTRCDNHPQRKARTYTGGGAFEIRLCEECTPPWFKADE